MADLFGRDVKTIGKHINNAVREELSDQVVVAKFATTTQHGAIEGKTQTHIKIFIEFIALIIRNKIYTCLKDRMKELKSLLDARRW